jgi:hypothetical protein
MLRNLSRIVALVLAALLAVPTSALAHNEAVHQRMTDYAYEVMLAMAGSANGGPMSQRLRILLNSLKSGKPAMNTFYADAATAVVGLRALKSGLPVDPAPCATPLLSALFGGGPPDWQLPPGVALEDLTMDKVRLPVTVSYGHGPSACAIDENWMPSGVLASVNPGGLTTRDHTGVTLGYWSAAPDQELKDWVLSSTTLEVLQNPAVVGSIAVGASVTVAALCALACGFFPVACALCPALAVGAGAATVDEITSIDADSLESDKYVGFGHFIDMKPVPTGLTVFDTKPGKFMERAGPAGAPDTTEQLVMTLFDLGGVHVNQAESLAPTNYEILLGASGAIGSDFHRNTTHRDPSQWETPTVSHLQLTAVDNLGMFGYEEAKAKKGTSKEAYRIGWPLHAIGDAAVPMHAVGASGYGHRPYEDCVDMVWDSLVGTEDVGRSLDTIQQVVQRALVWRQFIKSWRSLHGTTEVPVRDLVTAIAAKTRQKGTASPSVFKAAQSLQYLVDQNAATAAYDNAAMAAVQRDLVIEAVAAELAFLVSVTEVTP